MRRIASLLMVLLACLAAPALAQTVTYEVTEEVVYLDENGNEIPASEVEGAADDSANWRFVQPRAAVQPAAIPQGTASYGPFRVLDDGHAALVDVTDERSPAAFAAMLAAHPGIAVLELIECPGTEDDRANLALGRMIHAHGLATHVPDGGSVRSGGVELFLAGVRHTAAPGAEFAVHAWADEDGREATDYAANAPENRRYIDYYREMGMSPTEAQAFYAMTNAAPFDAPRWLGAAEMSQWVKVS